MRGLRPGLTDFEVTYSNYATVCDFDVPSAAAVTASDNLKLIDRREFAVRFLRLAALLALPAAPAAQAVGPYEVVVRRDIQVRARDGVLLATDIYLPAFAAGAVGAPIPAILE